MSMIAPSNRRDRWRRLPDGTTETWAERTGAEGCAVRRNGLPRGTRRDPILDANPRDRDHAGWGHYALDRPLWALCARKWPLADIRGAHDSCPLRARVSALTTVRISPGTAVLVRAGAVCPAVSQSCILQLEARRWLR